jgi:hypothetical protein
MQVCRQAIQDYKIQNTQKKIIIGFLKSDTVSLTKLQFFVVSLKFDGNNIFKKFKRISV